MRKLIENPSYMDYDEIKKEFWGKWVLITNCNFTPCQELLGGIPVAVADTVYEGREDGFYSKFRAQEYAPRTYMNFNFDELPNLFLFYGEPETDGGEDASRIK